MVDFLKPVAVVEASRICRERCAYATLLVISYTGEMSHSKLTRFLADYTLEKGDLDSELSENIVKSLLRSGHIYEVRGGFYSALPSYAIQRNPEEWMILGDARVDSLLKREAVDFRVTDQAAMGEAMIERRLLASDGESRRVFHLTRTRTFDPDELVGLVPDTRSLGTPKVWPDYGSPSHRVWQKLNQEGSWEPAELENETHQTLCRGLITDRAGNAIGARYFFRHTDGWSPITYDEASLWVFKLAAKIGSPYTGRYLTHRQVLMLPVGLPYAAYVVLGFLGHTRTVKGDRVIVEGIGYDIAQTICERLDIRLITEVAS